MFLTWQRINFICKLVGFFTTYRCGGDSFADGTIKWSQMIPTDIRYAAAISKDGTIYVGINNGELYVFDSNGNMKFGVLISYGISLRPPAIGDDGNIYVQSSNNALYRVTPAVITRS